jgi:DNA-binding PadR family transcriptional regulator
MSSLTPDETILGLLAVQARHGYELLECFRSPNQLGRVWHLSTSQLYAVLKRLEREGLIVGREVIMEAAPPRTEYTLTEVGQQHLYAWLNEPRPSPSIRRIRVEFLSRLYIAQRLNIPTDAVIRHQRAACLARVEELAAERDHAAPGIEALALEFQLNQQEAALRWLERCELTPASE